MLSSYTINVVDLIFDNCYIIDQSNDWSLLLCKEAYHIRRCDPSPQIKYIQIWNSRVFPYYFVSSRTRQLASPHAPHKIALASVILRIFR